ncbi:hypothetical protein AAHC03_022842 [Spirometra sp. Aus1]
MIGISPQLIPVPQGRLAAGGRKEAEGDKDIPSDWRKGMKGDWISLIPLSPSSTAATTTQTPSSSWGFAECS